MDNKHFIDWLIAAERLGASEKRQRQIAAEHSCSLQTINWAIDNTLLGNTLVSRTRREAFLVERPTTGVSETSSDLTYVGYTARLGAGTPGNRRGSADHWRYTPSDIEPWPFVVGNLGTANRLICVGGEWGVLSVVDIMEWWREFPPATAIVGLRGPKSWQLFVKYYRWKPEPLLFAFDGKDSSKSWQREDFSLKTVYQRFKRIFQFHADIAELWRQRAITGDDFIGILARADQTLAAARPRRAATFLRFCYTHRDREDPIGAAARFLIRDRDNRPRGRPPLKTWQSYIINYVPQERLAGMQAALAEWLSA